jgi:hypothetical protein
MTSVRLDADLDVVIDYPLDRDEDFHVLHSSLNRTYWRRSGGLALIKVKIVDHFLTHDESLILASHCH